MPKKSQIEWWLTKEPDLDKARALLKQHQQSVANVWAKKLQEKFESCDTYGKWHVIRPITYKTEKTITGKYKYLVKVRCECGIEKFISRSSLTRGRSKSCRGCYHRGELNNRWNGYEDMTGTKFHKIRGSAHNRNIPFNVSRKELRDLLHKQNFKCALSGQELTWKTASVDRINSNVPYEINNLQWVLNEVNYMKHVLSQDRFIELCKQIAENNS